MIRRLAVLVSLLFAAGVWGPQPALVHGVGNRGHLPVPPRNFAIGARSALVVTVMTLVTNRPQPRLEDGRQGRPAVVLAYDRALAEFGHRNAARARYGILVLMILSTSLALLVLAR